MLWNYAASSGNANGRQAERDFHCTVYETRPLVCRVFGFAGDRDKWGHLRFAPCRHMVIEREPLDTAIPKALMKLRLYTWFSSPDKAA